MPKTTQAEPTQATKLVHVCICGDTVPTGQLLCDECQERADCTGDATGP